MKHTLKIFKRLFFNLFLAAAILSSLLVIIEFALPSRAAAENLRSRDTDASYQDILSTIASPPLFSIQATNVATLYLPIIFKNPILLYSDDFSDPDSGWAEVDDGDCISDYDSGRYRLSIDKDQTCIPRPAPGDSAAQTTFGEFQVSVYQSGENQSGSVSNAVFGIFTNGEGGANYYIFKIRPNISNCSNGGGWEFIRRKNNNETTLKRVDCTNLVIRGFGSAQMNTLKLKHAKNGIITLYINGTQVSSIDEASTGKELLGSVPGVYAEAASTNATVIKFDDFKVYSVP